LYHSQDIAGKRIARCLIVEDTGSIPKEKVEVSQVSVLLVLLFLGIALGIGYWLERRRAGVPREEVFEAKLPYDEEAFFVHPGHAWVRVVEPNLVTVGVDEFTRSVFGSVEELALPEPGVLIRQGGKGWRLKRGERRLEQTAPITGRVVEINRHLVEEPRLLVEKDTRSTWMLKVRPVNAKSQLKNLLHGNVLSRWNQSVKEQLVAALTAAEFPVLQEGGEIKSDLGDELTDQQWKKVSREFFD
jgi:glycine cleavage system H protein